MDIKSVGVIGAGNIGIGAVTDLILHGIQAVVVDVSDEVLGKARAAVLSNVRFAPMLLKSLPKISAKEALERMHFSTEIKALKGCEFVIENVTEDWGIKRAVYEELDRAVAPEVCFGANTSCISITKIAGATQRPANVVGIHLMNPVHLKPTVEVIRGFHTSAGTLEILLKLFAQLGKEAIIVEDLPGFVSNRISHLFMNEAAFVLQDHVATAAQIDAVFKRCFGHTMGPLETADLIGLDTVVRSLDVLYES
jgi:3-hydroxybutyryl-CoA dehydrogenase